MWQLGEGSGGICKTGKVWSRLSIQVASAGTRLYSALSSVRSKARKLSIAETASNDKAALLVLQFIACSREDVNRNMLELVSGFERTRLDHILKLFFRQGKIMVDFGSVYRKTTLRIDA
jgi:hypothetical protein